MMPFNFHYFLRIVDLYLNHKKYNTRDESKNYLEILYSIDVISQELHIRCLHSGNVH